jgi:hypothetical protein
MTACAGTETHSTATPTASAGPTAAALDAPAPLAIAPLRGTIVPAGKTTNPSLAVKIDNHEAARPQIALDRADIVFEELVEGGLTRYVGVWQSDIPDAIGPVRSIRPMDPDIITPGGQQDFVDMMKATPVINSVFDYDTTGLFSRVADREAPHNVVLKAAVLVGRNSSVAPPVQQFAYAGNIAGSTAAMDGTPITQINSRFSAARYPGWSWDAASQAYLRSQEGAPDLDTTGARRGATNVLVLRVDIDGTYGEVPKTVMIGSGEGSVSAGGKTVHATWSKAGQADPIRLTDDNGVTIRLAPGNSWIELVPNGTGSVELVP